jgi:hypothetical protein
MNGIRQSLSYHHPIVKKISIEVQLFTGSGKGKDVSKDFQKDYVLMSKANFENVPQALRPYNLFFEGIHSYKRISDGLRQDNGWGLTLHYKLMERKKLWINVGLGYLMYSTQSIVRNSVMDINISNPKTLGDVLQNYRIFYPASIYSDYKDGSAISTFQINYTLTERLMLGVGLNINRSFWNHYFNIGSGINIVCLL